MATSKLFIDYVYQQLERFGEVRYQKMFGEYMVYVQERPIFIVCDNTVFVKMKNENRHLFPSIVPASPYPSAKPHYVVDTDDRDLLLELVSIMVPITPIPKSKNKKQSTL